MGWLDTVVFMVSPNVDGVNVHKSKIRSPFRYPGGKSWLAPQITQWVGSFGGPPSVFVDLFGGGGSVALLVAEQRLAQRVLLVEKDPEVAAVWHTIIYGDFERFACEIERFKLSVNTVDTVLGSDPGDRFGLAFRTIIKNRVNYGGVLAPGAGRIGSGENGRGLSSRWYPDTLAKRVREIGSYRDRVCFLETDAFEVLPALNDVADVLFFVDPPYSVGGKKAGRRLYRYHELDHDELFLRLGGCRGDFLMTYDNSVEVKQLVQRHGLVWREVVMRGNRNVRDRELLIGRKLGWVV